MQGPRNNTNNLKFELYAVLVEIDGMSLSFYRNCGNSIRTGIIIDFLLQLKTKGLESEFFLTDKDFAQISAALVQQLFSFIDPTFQPILTNEKIIFCSKELRASNILYHGFGFIYGMISIVQSAGFCGSEQEIVAKFQFLKQICCGSTLENLVVFIIMEQVILHQQRKFEQIFLMKREKADWRKVFRKEWKEISTRTINNIYLKNGFVVWIPGIFDKQISYLQTSCTTKGIVTAEFFKQVHRHTQYPFISLTPIINFPNIIYITNVENYNLLPKSIDSESCEELYNHLINVTENTLEILKDLHGFTISWVIDQQVKKNSRWV
ncbi:hypothetical protein Glove_41g125 [Diversispora epigaea]|uniref:Uncharacterized protein n=1 Tax=Diversispora epigaea TaxID=1348612 RepID=A0A397JJL2_9GLOM|nr:hypothetical protein Glove_41g125 [Diversispora epigaea]